MTITDILWQLLAIWLGLWILTLFVNKWQERRAKKVTGWKSDENLVEALRWEKSQGLRFDLLTRATEALARQDWK
jgi:hypothetical protein